MRSALTAFRPFQPDTPLRNASTIFILTTLFYFVGAELRLVEALSLFWPLNGVMAGIFARYVFLNRLHYYAVSYIAMLMYDAVTTNWGIASVVINLSNMVFIVVVALLIQRDRRLMKKTPDPLNALRLFNYCLIAALLCALLGAVGSVGIDSHTFWPLFADWFSEQFSTGVLVLPCMLTIGMPVREFRLRLEQLLPVIALIVSVVASVVIGGAGSLSFPLPALIWCAVRYPLPVTCLLTFVTGAIEIILVANSVINIAVATPLTTPMMFSARLGIATMAICPVLVSVSMAAINSLIRQVSLRADYDFLTQVYSRSGLYEALKHEETHRHSRFLTVMLLDIDYFKSINDNYGHECGDRVLASFARQVQQVVGEDGMVARMGGEEFAVVVNSGDARHGYELAERIRTTVANHPFTWRQQTLSLTVSIGLGSGKAEAWQLTEVFNKLMTEADDHLYRSKKAGRNRTSARVADEHITAATGHETELR
ncbi:GGDEF domain-containing protein [Enterobacter roggenkampii]